jgi:hypothetical protein
MISCRWSFGSGPLPQAPPSHIGSCHIVKHAAVMHRMLADGTPFAAERAAVAA